MRKYTAAPHPFVLDPPPAPDDVHDLTLTLIGRGNLYLPYFIHSLQRAGERGLGKTRLTLMLTEVSQAEPPESGTWVRIYEPNGILQPIPPSVPSIPPLQTAIRLHFETPLRLQSDDSLVTPETFRFRDLFGALLRRISMLSYFHTDTPLETDFAGLVEKARHIEILTMELKWRDWTRYSSRQKTAMQMGGLVGEIVIDLGRDSPFWPYVWLGQWLHAGKGTSMGLGRYTIEPASLPNAAPGGG